MDFSSLGPRLEPLAPSNATALAPPPGAVSTAAETARPVLAAAKSDAANGSTREQFQPLDTFEVGDNDDVPVPPEPPRKATYLSIIPEAPEVEAPQDTPSEVPAKEAPEVSLPKPPLEENLRAIEGGPENPTVDIRR